MHLSVSDFYSGYDYAHSISDKSAPASVMRSVLPEAAFEQPGGAEEAADRKKTYTAGCTVRTPSPAEAILEAVSAAEKYGGWIESSDSSTVVLRVPSQNLLTVFEIILDLGRVVEKYIEAEDVTDRYADLNSRLEIFEASKNRLTALLAGEKSTDEKIRLLREIRRIDDQIDMLKISIERLERDIEYSVIYAGFISYEVPDEKKEIPFPWIAGLDPFKASVNNLFRRVFIDLSDDFAVVDNKHYFQAETSGGTVLRISTIKNTPYGNSGFWQKALEYHLKDFFAESSLYDAGNVRGVIFSSRGSSNEEYRYFAGTKTFRKLLYIIEVYFPDNNAYENLSDSVFTALEGITVK